MATSQVFKPFKEWKEKKENKGKFTWTIALYGTEAMAKSRFVFERILGTDN